jgi:hypothetical protein
MRSIIRTSAAVGGNDVVEACGDSRVNPPIIHVMLCKGSQYASGKSG